MSNQKVNCPKCGRSQPDEGKRTTCRYCGLQPIPSSAYPRKSVFHPKHIHKPTTKPPKKPKVQPRGKALTALKDKLGGSYT